MKRKETAKFLMIEAVEYFFKQNIEMQDEIIKLKECVILLNERGSRMRQLLQQRKHGLEGITLNKQQVRNKLIDLLLKMAKVMEARAKDKKDAEMMKAVHCSLSDLRRPADKVFVKRCKLIRSTAEKQKRFLKEYGLTDEMLQQAQELLLKFETLIPKNKNERSKNAALHNELKKLVQDTCYFLKYQMDALMNILSEKHFREKDIYKRLRKVICYGRKRKAYGGRFKDKQTGKPLKEVQMTVLQTAEKLVTDFANTVTVIIEKAGYKKIEIKNVDIMLLNELAAELEPETEPTMPQDSFTCFE
ncbi:MAG TPA: hypothetical protein VJY62_10685 [Bacteroidia bacterium]|nr:hypothetical protein [Bacteroidia bacterium]